MFRPITGHRQVSFLYPPKNSNQRCHIFYI